MREHYGQVQARADLPWQWREHMMRDTPSAGDIAMAALHTAPVAATALTGAIQEVCTLGEICGAVDPEHVDRLCAIADLCEGMSFDEVESIYGSQHAHAANAVVGSFFKKFGKLAKGVAKGIAHTALPMAASFVPGGSAALHAGSRLLRGRSQPPPVRPPQQTTQAARAAAPSPQSPPSPFAAVDDSGGRTTIVHFH